MNGEIKKKLTIILPLKERSQFVKRFFLYISKINFSYNLIIADGSKKKLSEDILRILKVSNINYDYYKFPEDKNYNLFLEKIYKSLTYVETRYVMLFSDDDFPILHTIEKSIKFLDKNKTFKSAGGYLINFNLFRKKENKKKAQEIYGNPINISKIYTHDSCNHETRIRRLKFFLTEGREPTWHYIWRKEVLINTYKKAKNVKFCNNSFNDWLVDCLNYIGGKIKKINAPLLIHQYHSFSEINNRPGLISMLKERNFNENKKIFISFLNKFFVKKKNEITSFVNIFFSTQKDKHKYFNKTSYKELINSLFSPFLIKVLTDFYKILLNYYLYINNYHFKYFLKKNTNEGNTYIRKELLFFFNFIKKL
jgi:glycosyltransferase domain-containing protein